jgi:lipopolysaccharide export LptBFGC system permease protein LptF
LIGTRPQDWAVLAALVMAVFFALRISRSADGGSRIVGLSIVGLLVAITVIGTHWDRATLC